MKHVKTLNTRKLQNTVKKADAENARRLVSPHARHPVPLGTRLVRTANKTFALIT